MVYHIPFTGPIKCFPQGHPWSRFRASVLESETGSRGLEDFCELWCQLRNRLEMELRTNCWRRLAQELAPGVAELELCQVEPRRRNGPEVFQGGGKEGGTEGGGLGGLGIRVCEGVGSRENEAARESAP